MRTFCLLLAVWASTVGCSAVSGPEALDPVELVGRTYVVDFESPEVEINHAVWVLQSTMEVHGVLLQPDLDGDSFLFSTGLAEQVDGLQQMACLQPADWSAIAFEAPLATSETGDDLPFAFRYEGDTYNFTLLEATFSGSFSEDGSALHEVTIDAWFDVSEVGPYVEGDPCDLLPVLGLECGSCPGGGETCIKAAIDAAVAPEAAELAFDPAYVPTTDPACG
jgi:hypothetical protein